MPLHWIFYNNEKFSPNTATKRIWQTKIIWGSLQLLLNNIDYVIWWYRFQFHCIKRNLFCLNKSFYKNLPLVEQKDRKNKNKKRNKRDKRSTELKCTLIKTLLQKLNKYIFLLYLNVCLSSFVHQSSRTKKKPKGTHIQRKMNVYKMKWLLVTTRSAIYWLSERKTHVLSNFGVFFNMFGKCCGCPNICFFRNSTNQG